MTPEEAVTRSRNAQRLMEDPLLKEAMSTIENDVYEAWLACPVRDVDGREHLWRMAVSARKLKDIIRGTAESGKLAADELRRKEQTIMDRAKNIANWRR